MDTASYSDSSLRETAESKFSESVAQGRQFVEDQVAEHPTSAMLLSFVVGAGVGVAVGAALFDQHARRRAATSDVLTRISDAVTNAVFESLPHALKR